MQDKNKGPVVIVVIVSAIIAVAAFLGYLLFQGAAVDDPRAPQTRTPEVRSTTPESDAREAAPRTGAAVPSPIEPTSEEELERIREQAREAARAVNDGNDPIPCESVCDCPQGMECQMGSQLCLPSPFATFCCDKEGCPEGEACRHIDGRYGTCGDE